MISSLRRAKSFVDIPELFDRLDFLTQFRGDGDMEEIGAGEHLTSSGGVAPRGGSWTRICRGDRSIRIPVIPGSD